MSPVAPHDLHLSPNGEFPNSPFPVLIYRHTGLDDPAAAEQRFAANGWTGAWRDGIYDYHHFHSTAHEVLAIVAGAVGVTLGGPGGERVDAGRGDVLVLPAGTGHCCDTDNADLLVVGAYPDGMSWDVRRGDPSERDEVHANLAAVPLPHTDPLSGADGPLTALWQP